MVKSIKIKIKIKIRQSSRLADDGKKQTVKQTSRR